MQLEIKVKNGQSIYDIALFCYNDASLVYDLIDENPSIDSIGMDLTAMTLVYTPKKVVKYEAKENADKANKLVTIKQQQSLFDLSLQYYGGIDFIYDLIQNNSFIDSILSNDVNGNNLSSVSEKNYVTEFYNKRSFIVGTNIPKTEFLLQEDGYYILQETGSKILL
jgi:hypothetical protein